MTKLKTVLNKKNLKNLIIGNELIFSFSAGFTIMSFLTLVVF